MALESQIITDSSSGTDPILSLIAKINAEDDKGSLVDAHGNEVLTGEDKFLREMGLMQGLNTNFAHKNKWVGYFPLANILGKKYNNLELNLIRFSVPQMVMGATQVAFKGYTYQIPTKVMDADTKEIVIDYIVDEKWQNYKALAKWCSATEGQLNQVTSTSDVDQVSMTDFIDCRVWLLDSFKNRILDLVFQNCWIKDFQNLELESNSADEVQHSITLAYSNFYIESTD